MAILAFVAILVVLILVHEVGHFVAAKLSGVSVLEFGLGFPPRLVAVKWRGTEYSLNGLPLGGFVRLLGEEDPQEPRSLARQSLPIRFLVLISGSLMNVLLPVLLFTAAFMVPQQVPVGPVVIAEVAVASPAEQAGLRPGDAILELNGRSIRNSGELIYNIQLNLGREVSLLLHRDGEQRLVRTTPRWKPPTGEGALGILISPMKTFTLEEESHPLWRAFPQGMRTLGETLLLFRNEIASWFMRGTVPQIAGPIGIAQATGQVAQGGISPLLAFAAFISINLAIVNLMPIPALDGGRLIFVFLEAVRRGKKVSPRKEKLVHFIGFAVLIGIIAVVSYFDVLRLFQSN